jgi:hypothetical protein
MDAKIQATIREEFNDSLLLTGASCYYSPFAQAGNRIFIPVAHRLRTVIDYDRLIVLDKGKVCPLSHPFCLADVPGQDCRVRYALELDQQRRRDLQKHVSQQWYFW